MNALKNSSTAAPPTQALESSNGSSSLSELDEDENLEPTSYFNKTLPNEEDNDSEAETERLHQSPQKTRNGTMFRRTESGLRHHESINDASEDEGLDISQLQTAKSETNNTASDLTMNGAVTSPTALAGIKRKRLGDGLDATFMEPSKKRVHTTTRAGQTSDDEERASPASSGISDVSVRSYPSDSEDEEQATSGEGSVILKKDPEGTDDKIEEKLETSAGDQVEPEVEEDEDEEEEAEASVKGEDESKYILSILSQHTLTVHQSGQEIESTRRLSTNREAVQRIPRQVCATGSNDQYVGLTPLPRLHEERLAALDAELRLLNEPLCTHPDFLAQRQCIDARRDEKIQLERLTARLKQECLERTVVARRAQVHCQYFQEARQIREDCVTQLNEMYCKIQSERPQTKSKEPHFIYNLPAKRSQRIAYQTAYNKEVSVLSGIAKHIGFPAAPEIVGARPSEMEEDLRAMGIS